MIRSNLFIAIGNAELTLYQIRKIECGWELEKLDGTIYHVTRRLGRLSCDCRDFLHRKEEIGGKCKHLESLTTEGLL